ncbi:hypothetical protein EJD97_015485 [Solanum chilense]|uniref:Uncharacterized protein n=1 Tax=Solanum chilense TaxID=4083 RepID=A0A6N2C8V6_SOLCI|nr:hypothetical protein EJD97_015485 [Solanum chilense]
MSQVPGVWAVRSRNHLSSSVSLGGTLKASCFNIKELGWIGRWYASSSMVKRSLKARGFKLKEPGWIDQEIFTQTPGSWLAHKGSCSSTLTAWLACLRIQELGWRSQGIAPQAPGSWVVRSGKRLSRASCHNILEPCWSDQGVARHALNTLVALKALLLMFHWGWVALKALYLKLQGHGEYSQDIMLQASGDLAPQDAVALVALKALCLKIKEPRRNSQGVARQVPRGHGQCSNRYASSSRILGGSLTESCLMLWELGWHSKGIAPHILGSQVACLGSHTACSGSGIAPQALGALLAISRNHAFNIRSLGGLQGAMPQAQGTWVARSGNHHSRSRILVGMLKASCLKL